MERNNAGLAYNKYRGPEWSNMRRRKITKGQQTGTIFMGLKWQLHVFLPITIYINRFVVVHFDKCHQR